MKVKSKSKGDACSKTHESKEHGPHNQLEGGSAYLPRTSPILIESHSHLPLELQKAS